MALHILPADDDVTEALIYRASRALVDRPDAVRVTSEEHGRLRVYTVRVAEGEAGQLIGKQGRLVDALQTLARATARRQGADVETMVEIEQP